MFITLYALAVSLLVVGVLWAEACFREFYADNALTWARAALEERHIRRLSRLRVYEAAE